MKVGPYIGFIVLVMVFGSAVSKYDANQVSGRDRYQRSPRNNVGAEFVARNELVASAFA
jgi:hypothetical protein